MRLKPYIVAIGCAVALTLAASAFAADPAQARPRSPYA